jgi:hypothetical protein
MRITISRLVNAEGFPPRSEYALGEDGKKPGFATAREAINYLADRNWTITDLRGLDFNFEEEEVCTG